MSNQTPTLRDPTGHRMGRPPLDLQGQHFRTLEALRRTRDPDGTSGWLCRCERCGAEAFYATGKLRKGSAHCRCDPIPMGRPPLNPNAKALRERELTSKREASDERRAAVWERIRKAVVEAATA